MSWQALIGRHLHERSRALESPLCVNETSGASTWNGKEQGFPMDYKTPKAHKSLSTLCLYDGLIHRTLELVSFPLQTGGSLQIITFAVVFIPRIHTVLEPIAHQGVVDTHVTVAEEHVAFAGSWKQEESDEEIELTLSSQSLTLQIQKQKDNSDDSPSTWDKGSDLSFSEVLPKWQLFFELLTELVSL